MLLAWIDYCCALLVRRAQAHNRRQVRRTAHLHPSVRIGKDAQLDANVHIGEGTYFGNWCQFLAGKQSKVEIGRYNAIGHNVHIKARTHAVNQPTGNAEGKHQRVEKSVRIGDHNWIGDNVFIREGVTIGSHVIIGANSVVTQDLADGGIYGGVPAKLIRTQSPSDQP